MLLIVVLVEPGDVDGNAVVVELPGVELELPDVEEGVVVVLISGKM